MVNDDMLKVTRFVDKHGEVLVIGEGDFVVLDLSDDVDAVIAVLLEDVADLLDVLRLSYERSGDEVEFVLYGEEDIFLIFCRQRRQAKLRIRDIHALFRADRTAVTYRAVDVAALDVVDDELDQAVIDEDAGALFDVAGEIFVRNREFLISTDDVLFTDNDLGTLDEIGLSAFEFPGSDLRRL